MAKQGERMSLVKRELFGFRFSRFSLRFGRKPQPFLCHVFMIMVPFKFPLFEFSSQAGFDWLEFF